MRGPIVYSEACAFAAALLAQQIPPARDMTPEETENLANQCVTLCLYIGMIWGMEPEVVNSKVQDLLGRSFTL